MLFKNNRECDKVTVMEKDSEHFANLQAQRKTRAAGPGRRRKVRHKTTGYCLCVDCRKARGQYPETKSSNKFKRATKS